MVECRYGFGLTSGLPEPGAALEQSSNKPPEIGVAASPALPNRQFSTVQRHDCGVASAACRFETFCRSASPASGGTRTIAHLHARMGRIILPVGCKSQPMDRTGATGRGICFLGWTGHFRFPNPVRLPQNVFAPKLHRMGERQSRRTVATPAALLLGQR
jgi:hypothetical protein